MTALLATRFDAALYVQVQCELRTEQDEEVGQDGRVVVATYGDPKVAISAD